MNKKTIAIDARSLIAPLSGIGNYLLAMVNSWVQACPETKLYLLTHKNIDADVEIMIGNFDNVEIVVCPFRYFEANGLIWFLFKFEKTAKQLGADAIWGASGILPYFLSSQSILTVHDLVFKVMPDTMAIKTRLVYGFLAGRSISKANEIWSVSNYTKQQVEIYYPKRYCREIEVVYGLSPRKVLTCSKHTQLRIKNNYLITNKTLLFVGTVEPRKNLEFLLGLMPNLMKKGYNLLVVGCKGWGKAKTISTTGLAVEDSVTFCDYVSDEELCCLYSLCSMLVFPSKLEGCGLPLLESMALGTPVVGAANSSIIEVVGEGGKLVSGWDEMDWINAIEEVYVNRDRYHSNALLQKTYFEDMLVNFFK